MSIFNNTNSDYKSREVYGLNIQNSPEQNYYILKKAFEKDDGSFIISTPGTYYFSDTVDTGSGELVVLKGVNLYIKDSTTVAVTGNLILGFGGGGGATVDFGIIEANTIETATNGIKYVICDCFSSNVYVTLPAASSSNAVLTYKRIDSTNNILCILPSGEDIIDGESSININYEYSSLTFKSDSSANWYIVGVYHKNIFLYV
jgi:hypothetical protein